MKIRLGYEIPSGDEVEIPVRHMAVTGQTQESGKTTTLEALISRSGLQAVAFVTKRGESSFQNARTIPPYFRERADWQFVSALLEATLRERLKFERSWIMRVSKGAKTLADVHMRVREEMKKVRRGIDESILITLDEYFQIVIPQIERLPYVSKLELAPGLNVIDLRAYSVELNALVIRSVLEWVYEREHSTIVIVPEAWEYLPLQRGSPVKLAAEMFIRKSAADKNYLWLDSQDVAGVAAEIRRQVSVWILGVQREEHEISRALKLIPPPRPKADDLMSLGKGEFFACFGKEMRRTYVQPAWLLASTALNVAMGAVSIDEIHAPKARTPKKFEDEDMEYKALYESEKLARQNLELEVRELKEQIRKLSQREPEPKAARIAAPPNGDGEVAMSLEVGKPTIDLTVRKYVIEASDQDQLGRLALLLSEGFFDSPKKIEHINREFIVRGWAASTGRPSPKNLDMGKLAEYGFVRVVGNGTYQSVPDMKVRVKEVEAVA